MVSQLDQKLAFVFTLALSETGRDNDDLERASLMLSSFYKFFDEKYLDEFIIVIPPQDEEAVKKAIFPKFKDRKIRLLNENIICPEFLENPNTSNSWPKPNMGWYRQQLIKLAIYKHVNTRFYMTIDSDVIFTKPFSPNSLFIENRARLNTQYAVDYRKLYREDVATKEVRIRIERYKEVEKILKISCPEGFSERWYGETPVLLCKDIVQNLATNVENNWNQPWRQVFLNQLPWTEYALYFAYAEHTGLLDQYYCRGDKDTLLCLTDSLWQPALDYRIPRSLVDWNVSRAFDAQSPGIAIVIQSYLGYPVDDVREKINRYIS